MKKLSLIAILLAAVFSIFSFKKEASVSTISKSLVFPVANKSHVGSFWGAERDGGARSHEGIDIFASKGTPVVAISDGYIVDRGSYPRGGKVLWLRSSDHPITAYYAHLDKQLAKEGQYVRKGQVIGTVGKTGNARTTPPHLHFGIYKRHGAVNPLPYVKKSPKVVVKKSAKKKAAVKKTSKKKAVAKKTSTKKKRTRR